MIDLQRDTNNMYTVVMSWSLDTMIVQRVVLPLCNIGNVNSPCALNTFINAYKNRIYSDRAQYDADCARPITMAG